MCIVTPDREVSRSLDFCWARRGKIQLIWDRYRVRRVACRHYEPSSRSKNQFKSTYELALGYCSVTSGELHFKNQVKTERRKEKPLGTSTCRPVCIMLCNMVIKLPVWPECRHVDLSTGVMFIHGIQIIFAVNYLMVMTSVRDLWRYSYGYGYLPLVMR